MRDLNVYPIGILDLRFRQMTFRSTQGGPGKPRGRAVSDIRIQFATADDAGLLLQLIGQLADYERAPNAVVATEEDLRRYGFGPERHFEALLAFIDGEAARYRWRSHQGTSID